MLSTQFFLCLPPPFSSMQFIIQTTFSLRGIIVTLWSKDQVRSKAWITKECLNALQNVTKIDIKGFTSNFNFSFHEGWASLRRIINDLVRSFGFFKRNTMSFMYRLMGTK